MSEKIATADSIFGTGAQVAVKTDMLSEELKNKEVAVKTTQFGVPSESLEDYYKKTIELEEKIKKDEVALDSFFDDYSDDDGGSDPIPFPEVKKDEVKTELFEDFNETEAEPQKPIDIILNKTELAKELTEVPDSVVEELLKTTEGQQIKALCESPNYPLGFPSFEEVLKLKSKHDKLVFVITGNLLEEYQHAVTPKLFICTTFKTKDYLDFTSVYPDTDQIMLYPFVAARCTLFPVLDYETILEINAGIVKKIAENVLINSDYKTSIEVIVL